MSFQVKSRSDIFSDILRDAKKHPSGWNAIFGQDHQRLASDCYLFHPKKGLYLLKEYQKNPYEHIGVGGKIARRIDEDLMETSTSFSNGFGVVTGDVQKIIYHLRKGSSPMEIINAGIQGKNMGVQFPVKGHSSTSKDIYTVLQQQDQDKQKKIHKTFQQKASEQGLYKGFE